MNQIDVVIPTLRRPHAFTCFERLRHIPWPYTLHVVTEGRTWGEAVNMGLANTKHDVLLMDDDVFLDENTFNGFEDWRFLGDIFGFKLLFPDGRIQHMGGIFRNGEMGHVGHHEIDMGQFSDPIRVCHVTTSLAYIKRSALDTLGGIAENFPGFQMDDVDFSFRAIKAGLKIVCLPGSAIHMESASKKFLPQFREGISLAYEEIKRRHITPEFAKVLETFPQPVYKFEFAL